MKPSNVPAIRAPRGQALTEAALEALRVWPRQQKLTGEALAVALRVSRKALANRPIVVKAIAATKALLQDHPEAGGKPNLVGGCYESKISDLEQKGVMLNSTVEELRERLARVEHNAMLLGVEPTLLFRPIDPL